MAEILTVGAPGVSAYGIPQKFGCFHPNICVPRKALILGIILIALVMIVLTVIIFVGLFGLQKIWILGLTALIIVVLAGITIQEILRRS